MVALTNRQLAGYAPYSSLQNVVTAGGNQNPDYSFKKQRVERLNVTPSNFISDKKVSVSAHSVSLLKQNAITIFLGPVNLMANKFFC